LFDQGPHPARVLAQRPEPSTLHLWHRDGAARARWRYWPARRSVSWQRRPPVRLFRFHPMLSKKYFGQTSTQCLVAEEAIQASKANFTFVKDSNIALVCRLSSSFGLFRQHHPVAAVCTSPGGIVPQSPQGAEGAVAIASRLPSARRIWIVTGRRLSRTPAEAAKAVESML
jgi:hypothetical protein